MNLRFATSNDAAAIAALHAASWQLTYKNALREDYLQHTVLAEREAVWTERLASPKANQVVLLAEDESGVIGFACAYAAEHAEWGSYLDNLHVRPPNQGHGIGKALLVNMAKWCNLYAPERGLYLSVNHDNHRAQQFYIGLGARSADSWIWHAPDGSAVPAYWFLWESVETLTSRQVKYSLDRALLERTL